MMFIVKRVLFCTIFGSVVFGASFVLVWNIAHVFTRLVPALVPTVSLMSLLISVAMTAFVLTSLFSLNKKR